MLAERIYRLNTATSLIRTDTTYTLRLKERQSLPDHLIRDQ
jgi:hypothetical protein